MPELPEVETIRRQLARELPGKKITGIDIRLKKMVRNTVPSFRRTVLGTRVKSVKRRAKLLYWELDNGTVLLFHLKMTGQLVYISRKKIAVGGHPIQHDIQDLPNKYSHIIFSLAGGGTLFFNDTRQFGYVRYLKQAKLADLWRTMALGPEPLARLFTLKKFSDNLERRPQSKIKQLLMDQTFIAGVGNIYATEACWRAGIRPTRRAQTLTSAEQRRLFTALRTILRQAVKKQGTSSQNYVDAYGRPGEYVPYLKIYGRKGEPCPRCSMAIGYIVLGGRGTTFCPTCQQ